MKSLLAFSMFLFFGLVRAQTFYVPSGTGGIGSSTNGYVGIGTTSTPGSQLHLVSDTERETFRIYKNGNSSNYLNIWQGTGGAAIDPIGTGLLCLGYDQTTTVWINGNLGIGTRTPDQKLTVMGNITLDAGDNPVLYTGSGTSELNRYLYLLNAPGHGTASGLKAGGVLIADTYSYANPSKNDLIVKGNVGIGTGTASLSQKLTVKGTIYGTEVKVDLSVPGPDYVFENNYRLRSLEETKTYIDQNKHLPEVPSAKEMEANGINLSEMNMLLLKKVEELALYVIELKKEIDQIKSNNK